MRRNILAILLILCPVLCFAQYSDKAMYQAYLQQDMTFWNQYLHDTDWSTLTQKEKARYLNYEYGYVATAIDTKQDDAKQHVAWFLEHINAMESVLPASTILMYRSSYAAYRAKLSSWEYAKQGLRAFNLAKDAVKADENDPYALTLLGCVDFYAPSLFGGSKSRALQLFRKAERIFVERGDTINNWNYASVCMQMAMCLDKTGHSDEAIRLCEQLLQRDPNFLFIRDEYLPQLRKKKK